jgi:hypothetical protein
MGLVKVFILAIIFTLLQGRTVEKKKSANATSTHSLLVCSFFTKYLCWIALISSAWGFSKAYPIILQSTWRKPEVFGRVKLEAFFSHETDVKLWSDNCIYCRNLTPVTEMKDTWTDHCVNNSLTLSSRTRYGVVLIAV